MTNKEEKLIRALRTRQGRKKHSLSLCEGLRACSELAQSAPHLIKNAYCAEGMELPEVFNSIDFRRVSAGTLDKLSATVNSQGILIVAERPESGRRLAASDAPYCCAFVLDGVSDPGNMGTVIRTAKAAGLKELHLAGSCADPFSDKAIRAAMAAQFSVNLFRYRDLSEAICALRGNGYRKFWKTDPHGGGTVFTEKELFAYSAVVVGGEAAGVTPHPDLVSVTIPMPGGSESLNAAQAATIFMFEAVRRNLF